MYVIVRIFVLIMSLAVLQHSLIGKPKAQVAAAFGPALEVAAGVIGLLTVDKIFDKIQQTLDQAQKKAESTGNRLLGSGVEQSYVALKQLKRDLNEFREMTFQQISNERKLALWDLYKTADNLRKEITDDFSRSVVQAHKLLGRLRFISKDIGFLVVRVTPPILARHTLNDNPIRIFGVGFGINQGNKKFETTVKIGGQQIAKSRISIKEWGIRIGLSQDELKDVWKSKEYARVPLVLTTKVTGPGAMWCSWFGCKSSETFTAEYHLDLYPTAPSVVQVKMQGEQLVGTGQGDNAVIAFDLPDRHNSNWGTTTGPVVYAGDNWKWGTREYGSDRCERRGGVDGCPFTRHTGCRKFNDNTQIQCHAENGGGPVTIYFSVNKERYEARATNLGEFEFNIYPGENKRIEIKNASKQAWFEGALPTGKKINPTSLRPAGGVASDPVVCTSSAVVGDKLPFICRMHEVW